MSTPTEVTAAEAKACCAAAYSTDAVAMILGESYHPGGLALTRHLVGLLGLQPGQRVLDVASGPGSTALLLAREHDVHVDGVDLGALAVAKAGAAAAEQGLDQLVTFHVGDAERLPFDDASFDAVICECAFCTFPDKPTAAAELARVLKPGGRLCLSDVTIATGGLPEELAGLAGWVACLADARPLGEYAAILADAGLQTVTSQAHDNALATMVERIGARLVAFRMLADTPGLGGVDFPRALELTAQAARAVSDGIAGYGLLVAGKPGP